MIEDYLLMGIRNVRRRKIRSWLTMVGIFIGIATVVALISLGQGLQQYINEQFELLGTDKLVITAKGGFGPPGADVQPVKLTDSDLDVVRNTNGITDVSGFLYRPAKIEFRNQIRYLLVSGIPTDETRKLIEEINSFDIEVGRNLRKGEGKKVVLGHNFLDKNIFKPNLKVRDKIKINDVEFSVVGFYEVIGNSEDDRNVIIPMDVMKDLFDIGDEQDFIMAKTAASQDPEVIASRVEKNLRKHRNLDEGKEDFVVQTSTELIESFAVILNIVQVFLVGIAAISLIVGGIGIMNTMYTAVLERTNEIGVMKSIGAKNSDILTIFLIESGILGLLGGIIGVLLGIGLSKLVVKSAELAGQLFVQAHFPPLAIVATLVFAFLVGSISGILPAIQASKQNPVDALRYE